MNNNENTATKRAEDDSTVSGKQGITGIETPESSESKIENLKNRASDVKEKVSANLSGAAEKVSANLSGAADTVHTKTDAVQENLIGKADKVGEFAQQAAGKVDEYAHQTVEKANQIGHKAADVLASSSDYIKNFDLEETKQQVKESFKEKPELTIAIAGIFGLLIGLLLGRKSK